MNANQKDPTAYVQFFNPDDALNPEVKEKVAKELKERVGEIIEGIMENTSARKWSRAYAAGIFITPFISFQAEIVQESESDFDARG